MSVTGVALLVVAVIVGAAVAWLAGRARVHALNVRLAERSAAATERETYLQQAEVRLRDAFASASREALQSNSQAFLDLARTSMNEFQQGARLDLDTRQHSIDQMVRPLHEGLQRVGDMLQLVDRDRVASQATVVEHLRQMAEDQKRLVGETETLVRALRTPQVRGQWGEMQLRRAVELAGMVEHCDFVEQHTVHTEDGRLRPDLIVNLPQGKVVVVDAKAPLNAYLDAMEATEERLREQHLDRHAVQVRAHIKALAAKDYSNQFPNSPDFVVLFLPGEAFFSAACERDASLLEDAIRQGIIPASPTTLITVLKAVAYGWQQERIAQRAEQIRDLAVDLCERVRTVAEHLAKIRKGLETTVSAYNSAVGSMETRFLPTARRIRDLGAVGSPEIVILETVDSVPRLPAAPELVVAESRAPTGSGGLTDLQVAS